MKTPNVEAASNIQGQDRAGVVAYWLTISLIVAVPCVFSTAVYRMYAVPKFALLLTGAAVLLPLLLWITASSRQRYQARSLLKSRQMFLVSLFLIIISVSTVFGTSPVAELFGSSYNLMGLITHAGFFVVFASLIMVIGVDEKRFRWILWAITLTGLAIATYGYLQFFGRDPFVPSQFYTFESSGGRVLRIIGTLGHSNYLGNFLLYVAPVAAGLALNSRGTARRVGLATAVLSAAAIIFSGTRGAWLGLASSLLTFVALANSKAKSVALLRRRATVRWVIATSAVIVLFGALIALSPASRNIAKRARLLGSEQTGSGRTLLWRDSIKMLAQHPLTGCGPEGFRKAFLPYKSIELARFAPRTNNESSHSSYLDAALSYGLIGLIVYVAIIASSFRILMRARRLSRDAGLRTIIVSLIASLAGVVVHNIFIFGQISTGLYFFVFAALAQAASHVTTGDAAASPEQTVASENTDTLLEAGPRRATGVLGLAILVIGGGALFVATAWYSISIVRADSEIRKAVAAAADGDLGEVLRHGNLAISHPDPAGDHHFLFAQALALCGDNMPIVDQENRPPGEAPNAGGERKFAFTQAMTHAEASIGHTLTPDATYMLLGYFALQLGQPEKLFSYAGEAVRTDPNFTGSHWLMAEAYLARGEREAAAREARLALRLDPNSHEAISTLKKARGVPDNTHDPVELINYAKELASKGKFNQAQRALMRAIQKSAGPCPDCHAALAVLYEDRRLYREAIAEWKAFAEEAPKRASDEKTSLRIEGLERELNR